MFRKFFSFLLVLYAASGIAVSGNSWEHLPLGKNYFDPDNYFLLGEYYDWEFYCKNPFRIKENTVYSLYSRRYGEYFFASADITFYDGAGNKILKHPPARIRRYLGYGIMEISFTSPVGARYLSLDFSISIASQPPLCEDELYEAIMIYEGANADQYEEYRGPDMTNEVVDEGMWGFFRTNVDSPVAVSALKSALKAWDYVDGNVEIEILEDAYSANRDRLGTYHVLFGATDSSGNVSAFRVYIEIFDDTPPLISGSKHLVASAAEPLTAADIKSMLTVTDNYDQEVELLIAEDGYTPNCRKIGTYRMVFLARDSSGNESCFTMTIEVRDLEGPRITGPQRIRKPYQETLLLEEILKKYRAADDIDGDVSGTIRAASENYTENMYEIGVWTIRIEARDGSGNVSWLDAEVEVYDGKGPVFIIQRNKIDIELQEEAPDLTALVYGLQKSGNLPRGVLRVDEDGYSENKKIPGTHRVTLAGEGGIYELSLNIREKQATASKTLWERIISFFRKILN